MLELNVSWRSVNQKILVFVYTIVTTYYLFELANVRSLVESLTVTIISPVTDDVYGHLLAVAVDDDDQYDDDQQQYAAAKYYQQYSPPSQRRLIFKAHLPSTDAS